MKQMIILAATVVAALAMISPASAQDRNQQNPYQGGQNQGQRGQDQADRAPGDRLDEIYREGYRAGYTAARSNRRYDDRRPPDDNRGYRDDRGQQR
jgi:opacity protein-like surface antigen